MASSSAHTVTRSQVADAVDDLDDQLADLQELKKAVYQNYRAALASRGFGKEAIRAETSTLKLAIRQRRNIEKDPEAARARRGLFDEILTEITAAPSRGAHARSKDDASADDRPLHAVIADDVAEEVAAAETAAKLADEDEPPEDRRKAAMKAAADRAEARSKSARTGVH